MSRNIVFALLLAFLMPSFASADVVYSTVAASSGTGTGVTGIGQYLFTSAGGYDSCAALPPLTLQSLDFPVTYTGNSGWLTAYVLASDGSSWYTAATSTNVVTFSSSGTKSFTFADVYLPDLCDDASPQANASSPRLAVLVSHSDSIGNRIYNKSLGYTYYEDVGLQSNGGGLLQGNVGVYTASGTNGRDIADVTINGLAYLLPSSGTQITSINSPTANTVTGSTDVTFDFDYYYSGDGVDAVVGFDLRDLSTNQTFSIAFDNVLASGSQSFTRTMALTSGHAFMWKPVLRDSTTNAPASWVFFSVVSGADFSSIINATSSISQASSTDYFASVPGWLMALPVFSTGQQLFLLYTDFTVPKQSTTTMSISYNQMGVHDSIQIDIASIMQIPALALLRDLMGWLVYISLGYLAMLYIFKVL